MKDRYWTKTRAAVVEGSSTMHPESRHCVLDGRLRGQPEGEDKLVSLFFCVTREDDPKSKAINMVHEEAVVETTSKVKLAGSTETIPTVTHKIKYLVTPKGLAAGVRLVAQTDPNIAKAL